MEAAVVGMAVGIRGDSMSGAPNGVAVGVLKGVAKPGMAGDRSLWVSAAAAIAIRRHSSSQAKKKKKGGILKKKNNNYMRSIT